MQEILQVLLLSKLDRDPQFIHDIVVELSNQEKFCEVPELGERKNVRITVSWIKVDLLSVESVDKETEGIGSYVWEVHGLCGSFSEVAVEDR
jgi:hypothetical protein